VVQETLSQKHPSQKRVGGVAQGVDPEFKLQYHKKKKKKKSSIMCQEPKMWFVCWWRSVVRGVVSRALLERAGAKQGIVEQTGLW
jgi:hypothetical protein